MIVQNTRVFYFMITLFSFADIVVFLSYGYVSIFLICFEVLLALAYIIFRPIRIKIDTNITIYYLFPKRAYEINSSQVIFVRAYQQGSRGGGGYVIKLKYLNRKGQRKTLTLLESLSENKKDQIIETFRSYGFIVKKED